MAMSNWRSEGFPSERADTQVRPYCCLMPRACRLFNHLIRLRKQIDRNCQADLFCSLQVNDKFKLRRLLYRQISRLGTFQDLVHVNSRAPMKVNVVRSIRHETALINKLFLEVNSRQPVFSGKLNDPLSFREKGASGHRHNRAYLFLLGGFKGALQTFGVGLSLDLLKFQLQRHSCRPEVFQLKLYGFATLR